MDSAERAEAIDREVWRLRRPLSVHTQFYYPRITHPTTGQVAIVGQTDEEVKIHPDVDLTNLLALLPEVPQAEKDGLVAYIDANRGGTVPFGQLIPSTCTVPFGQLIPSTSTQLTEVEAEAEGWLPDPIDP
jgi:hypothetical protein